MSTLNSAWRKLRRQAGDAASNASSLEQVAIVKIAALKSATLIPEKAKDVPAADREKFVQAYKKQMEEFLADLDKLAAAFKANDNATAQTLVTKLGTMQRDGHKEFRREEP
jgi:soluble cytochrome b562